MFDCPRCERFVIEQTALSDLPETLRTEGDRALVSHVLCNADRSTELPFLTTDVVRNIIQSRNIPDPAELQDNLIRWLGQSLPSPEHRIEEQDQRLQSIIGAVAAATVPYIIGHLEKEGLVTRGSRPGGGYPIGLSLQGWQRYAELRRSATGSRTAFMAMQFNDSNLDDIYMNYFRPGTTETGYDLRTVLEGRRAGLIDPRMLVEIRNARFCVSDLSHGNNNVYWEAGFAEGLGRPVIYTCDERRWSEVKKHFDTNHRQTVVWSVNRPDEAKEELKAVIRNTLPFEAKMRD